jgi:anaerobic magnesium-protoporphyrin IX monomethyl ester cyclase
MLVRTDDGEYSCSAPGVFLSPEAWKLPDVTEIPYDAYDKLYRDDLNKFCGIPDRRELVVPVARGCPIGCSFCEIPAQQGLHERRLPVQLVIDYIGQASIFRRFDYVSFYAPTFTLRRDWVERLCSQLSSLHRRLRWKCVTTLWHLDEDLIRHMAESGCIRISVGLETLSPRAEAKLPKVKHMQFRLNTAPENGLLTPLKSPYC